MHQSRAEKSPSSNQCNQQTSNQKRNHIIPNNNEQWDPRMFNYENTIENNHKSSQTQNSNSHQVQVTRKSKSPVEKKTVWSRVKTSIFPNKPTPKDTLKPTNITKSSSSSPTLTSPISEYRQYHHNTNNQHFQQVHQQIDVKILENVKQSNFTQQTQLPFLSYMDLNKFLSPYLMDDIILTENSTTTTSNSTSCSTLLVPLNSMSRPLWLEARDEISFTIGRSTTPLLLNIKSAIISRKHCQLYKERNSNNIQIEDLSSSTGTWKNGKRIHHASLDNGDIIQIGTGRKGHLPCQILILRGERLSSSLFENLVGNDLGFAHGNELLSPSRDTITSIQSSSMSLSSSSKLNKEKDDHHYLKDSLKLYMECYPSSKENEGLSVLSLDGLPLWRAGFMGSIPATLSIHRLLDCSNAVTLRRCPVSRGNPLLSLEMFNSKNNFVDGGIDVISKSNIKIFCRATGRSFNINGDISGGSGGVLSIKDSLTLITLSEGKVDIIGQEGKRTIVSMESLSLNGMNQSEMDLIVMSVVFIILVQLVKV